MFFEWVGTGPPKPGGRSPPLKQTSFELEVLVSKMSGDPCADGRNPRREAPLSWSLPCPPWPMVPLGLNSGRVVRWCAKPGRPRSTLPVMTRSAPPSLNCPCPDDRRRPGHWGVVLVFSAESSSMTASCELQSAHSPAISPTAHLTIRRPFLLHRVRWVHRLGMFQVTITPNPL